MYFFGGGDANKQNLFNNYRVFGKNFSIVAGRGVMLQENIFQEAPYLNKQNS